MKIALVGFGNMGKEVAKLIETDSQHSLVSVSFKDHNRILDIEGISRADIVIDFTSAEIVLDTIKQISKVGVPLVIGTTGWYEYLPVVKQIVQKTKTGLVYGQNFSIGANIFFQTLSYASKIVSEFEGYDVYGLEIHHGRKKDSPSGTAKKMADILLKNFPKKEIVQPEKLNRQIQENELHIASLRGGINPGFHEVTFDCLADEIKISHQAHSRVGFAQGALFAAEFIKSKKGIYTFDEVFERQVRK